MILALSVGSLIAAAGLMWAGGAGSRALVVHSVGVARSHDPERQRTSLATMSFASRHWRRDRAAEAAQWVTLIRRLAALLNAGRSPSLVFGQASRATSQSPANPTAAWIERLCRDVHAASELGVPASVTLGRIAQSTPDVSDHELARWARSVSVQLAACWEISERSGASLSKTLNGLADSVESQIDAQAARDSALAGPRATVRVLAWLPVLALGLGMLMGTDPITTLITTPWGRIALIAGAVLTVAGRLWTRQLMRHAEGVDGP
ncbi:type II secretion system F family protein [Kocuria carniphila]|uniref:type II secretion system F family protein n=1 Tax=Kocuria carniphila TaxID=262208 RepID=UPI0021A744EC|nr:type II secretion system F family protein [Kocuria carniphila]MCT1801745.1 type II secretion system F family protein [Kocuria carniphila]